MELDTGEGEDDIYVKTIGGTTTVKGGSDADQIYANFVWKRDTSGGNARLLECACEQTGSNGLDPHTLNLHGNLGLDTYEIGLAGEGSALINVSDQGSSLDNDRLRIYGNRDGQ